MIQLGEIIIDLGQGNDRQIIITITDVRLIFFSTILLSILKHTKNIDKILQKK